MAEMAPPPSAPVLKCQRCGADNTTDARFCEGCGGELASPEAATVLFDTSGAGGAVTPGAASALHGADAERLLALTRVELSAEYDVEREVGRGGMAVVFKAKERELRRTVALKVLPPGLILGQSVVDRFKREAQMAASLDHPNIIPIYRVGQTGQLLYLAMKYVEGRALDSVIAAQGALPIAVVMPILRAAAGALAYAHEHGIIHRDIKGGNILIDSDGRVIVTDFGVARATENASMTTTGSVIGTPYFMSPEQCAGKIAVPQSDQYSLGVVAFQMLTGAVPFQADTLAAIMHHHFFTPVPDVRVARDDVPPELIAILNRVLSKEPERRYATTQALVAALEAVPLTSTDRVSGETMLRDLAHGSAVPVVSTEALPPLADTMHIVAAHDALMRSGERSVRIRRRAGGVLAGVAAAALIGLWMSRRGTPHEMTVARSVHVAPAVPAILVPPAAPPAPVTPPPAATPIPAPPSAQALHRLAERQLAQRQLAERRRLVAAVDSPGRPAADTVIAMGKLRLRAFPSDAEIYVDGKDIGQGAVVDASLRAGVRALRVTAPGYVALDTTFVVTAGETTQLTRIRLKAVGSDP